MNHQNGGDPRAAREVSDAQQIVLEALESLRARQREVGANVFEIRKSLEDAMQEQKALDWAIREQEAAIARIEKAQARRGVHRNGSMPRPWAAREPSAGSQPAVVLALLRDAFPDPVTRAELIARSELPSQAVGSAVNHLLNRGYVDRVSEGVYRATAKQEASSNA